MQSQKFRLSLKTLVSECSVIFFALPSLGIPLCAGTFALEIMRNNEIGQMRIPLLIFSSAPAILITIMYFILIFIAVGRGVFSYLLLSDQGIEYRLWPALKIRCAWDDIDQIRKSVLPLQGDILMLKKADVSGFSILSFNKGNFGAAKTVPVIPLFQINGWPNGRLENEMRKYAPSLFIDQVESNSNKLQ